MPAKRLVFPVARFAFQVFVAFVGRDIDDRSDTVASSRSLKNIRRPHYVGTERLDRVGVGRTHQRLRSHVNNDVRPEALDKARDVFNVTNIAGFRLQRASDFSSVEKIRFRCGGQCESGDFSTEPLQPNRQPAAFEPGVAGDKNTPGGPEVGVQSQVFQGASPSFQAFLSSLSSCNVSTHCQYPLCT